MTILFLLRLFVVGFGLNLLWEFGHHQLYETCRRQTWKENVPLLVVMSAKDGFWIVLFYVIAASVFKVENVLLHREALLLFAVLSFGFSFVDERISLSLKRWEYAPQMPTVFGVGITPLLEIAVTGLAAMLLVF